MEYIVENRMREIAGLPLMEAKKAIKESLTDEFGSLGAFVDDTLEHLKDMGSDPDFAGETDPSQTTPEYLQTVIEDMLEDQLAEIFQSESYKQKCAELGGQITQVSADPEQRTLDV